MVKRWPLPKAKRRAVMKTNKFDTISVHGIYDMEAALANQGSIIEPGYLSSAEHFESSDHMEAALAYLMPAWVYSRIANPTVHYLEETLARSRATALMVMSPPCHLLRHVSGIHGHHPFLENPDLGDEHRRQRPLLRRHIHALWPALWRRAWHRCALGT